MSKIELCCVNHPNKRWHTKPEAVHNGRYTGARNIFFNPMDVPDMGGECDCPASDLIAVSMLETVKP